MKILTSVICLGVCLTNVWSVSFLPNEKGQVGKFNCNGTDMTVAIDNSIYTSKETFQFIKQQLKEVLFRSLVDDFRYENIRMSIHTFGESVYMDDEVGFSLNSSELLKGIDNLAYHGDQNPRVDNSLRHFQENLNSSRRNIYFYIGNGDSQYLNRLTERVQLVKEIPNVNIAVIANIMGGGIGFSETPEHLKTMSTEPYVWGIDADPYNIAMVLSGYLDTGSCRFYYQDDAE